MAWNNSGERVADGADVLRRGVAFGPDERQAVLELAQGASRRRIQQSLDRRPILDSTGGSLDVQVTVRVRPGHGDVGTVTRVLTFAK
jgi:hypothetical protein